MGRSIPYPETIRPGEADWRAEAGEDMIDAPNGGPFGDMTIQARHALALRYAKVATWAWDVASDRVDADPGLNALFGLPQAIPMTSKMLLEQIHTDDRIRTAEALARSVATGEPFDQRFRVVDRDGHIRWLRGIGEVHATALNGDAETVIGVNMDVSDLVNGEERLIAVVGEMRHRIKNSLAMVSALVTATAREADDIDDYADKLRGRIDALAGAQRTIGTTGDTTLVNLRDAVEGALAPFLATRDWQRRIEIAIEDIPIAPSLGQAVALAIHELATNAIKYGALIYQDGSIRVSNRIGEEGRQLDVLWDERHDGEQIAVASQSSGFGTKLIDRLIRSERGTIERKATDGAYRVELSFPIRTPH